MGGEGTGRGRDICIPVPDYRDFFHSHPCLFLRFYQEISFPLRSGRVGAPKVGSKLLSLVVQPGGVWPSQIEASGSGISTGRAVAISAQWQASTTL